MIVRSERSRVSGVVEESLPARALDKLGPSGNS